MVFWEGHISDELMGTFAPIVVYWLYAGAYQLLPPLDRYRLHTRKEEEQRNLVPLPAVVRGVLLQQLVQATVAHGLFLVTSKLSLTGTQVQPWIPIQLIQILTAMVVMDTWQYFVHRYMHQNKFLYRHVHSQHHRLVVPYAIGALYNHPLEGRLLDTFGGAISFLVSGMTPRTAVFFFCFAVIKTVDDHCGLSPSSCIRTLSQLISAAASGLSPSITYMVDPALYAYTTPPVMQVHPLFRSMRWPRVSRLVWQLRKLMGSGDTWFFPSHYTGSREAQLSRAALLVP